MRTHRARTESESTAANRPHMLIQAARYGYKALAEARGCPAPIRINAR